MGTIPASAELHTVLMSGPYWAPTDDNSFFRRWQWNRGNRTGPGSGQRRREFGTAACARGVGSVVLFDADYGVAFEGDESGFRGRSAIDPVFGVVAFGVALADFVFGAAHGGEDHFGVHADDGALVLDGLLELRGEGIDPVDGR